MPIPGLNSQFLEAGARTVKQAAGDGLSAGARSVREVANAFAEPSWSEERRKLVLPPEMRQEKPDLILLLVAFVLFVVGLILVFSSSTFVSQVGRTGPYDRLIAQGSRGMMGLLLMVGVARVDYRRWAVWGMWAALLTLLLLLLVLVPGIGHMRKGAQRWLFGIQPTEFARVALMLYLARLLCKRPERIESFTSGPLPALLVAGLFMGLILLQKSLGSAIALGLTAFGMCVVAGMRWKHFFWIAAPAAVLGILFFFGAEVLHTYQSDRIDAWVAFWRGTDNGLKDTYQLRQSILALGSGGWTGKGIGAGQQKWFFLPDAHTDFIFSILGEEMGVVGTFGVLLAFALLVWRGLRIAAESEDRYGYILAAGISINFATYAAINMSVTTGLIPTTGLPLPFISYGGSALIANMIALGLLLSVSRHRDGGIVLGGRVRRRASS